MKHSISVHRNIFKRFWSNKPKSYSLDRFEQDERSKKDSKNGAAGNFFGPTCAPWIFRLS